MGGLQERRRLRIRDRNLHGKGQGGIKGNVILLKEEGDKRPATKEGVISWSVCKERGRKSGRQSGPRRGGGRDYKKIQERKKAVEDLQLGGRGGRSRKRGRGGTRKNKGGGTFANERTC